MSISYLKLRLLGGGAAPPPLTPEQFLSSARMSGPFLPAASMQPAGPDSEEMHHLAFKKNLIALQWRLLAVILPDWICDGLNWKYLSSSVLQKLSMKQIRSRDCHSLPAPKCIRPHKCFRTAFAIKHCLYIFFFLLYSSGCLII